MREGELLALDYDDFRNDGVHITKTYNNVTIVDGDGNRHTEQLITSPKSKTSIRFVPLDEITLAHLQEHKKAQIRRTGISPHVFTSASGKRLNKNNVRRMYMRILKRAGVEPRKFHTMRHTFITNCIEADIDIAAIQDLVGHSDPKMTKRYIHIRTDHKREAIKKLHDNKKVSSSCSEK